MQKLSGIILALLVVVAISALLVVGGCKQELTASPQVAKQLFPNGTDTVAIPDAAKRAPDNTPPPSLTKQTPPPAAPKDEKKITAVEKSGKYTAPTDAEVAAAKKAGKRKATVKTEKGEIVAELDGAEAPLTVANFVKLAKAHFYDGLSFHRVVPGFVIQGGDPKGDGSGGPGYSIKLEISKKLRHDDGALAMARSGDPNSAGSQFYFCLGAQHSLDDQYAVFGKITSGLDVCKKIVKGDKILSVTIE